MPAAGRCCGGHLDIFFWLFFFSPWSRTQGQQLREFSLLMTTSSPEPSYFSSSWLGYKQEWTMSCIWLYHQMTLQVQPIDRVIGPHSAKQFHFSVVQFFNWTGQKLWGQIFPAGVYLQLQFCSSCLSFFPVLYLGIICSTKWGMDYQQKFSPCLLNLPILYPVSLDGIYYTNAFLSTSISKLNLVSLSPKNLFFLFIQYPHLSKCHNHWNFLCFLPLSPPPVVYSSFSSLFLFLILFLFFLFLFLLLLLPLQPL